MSQLTSTTLGRTTRRVPTAVLALTLAAAVLLVSLGLAIVLTPAGATGAAIPAGPIASSVMRDGPHLDVRWSANAVAPAAPVADLRSRLESAYLREISVGWGASRDTARERSQPRGIQPR